MKFEVRSNNKTIHFKSSNAMAKKEVLNVA
jgi:hypothetical protein